MSPWDTNISKILIWFTYTNKKSFFYVKHTLCKYLSNTFNIKKKADKNDFTKFGMKIGTVQDLQELPIAN